MENTKQIKLNNLYALFKELMEGETNNQLDTNTPISLSKNIEPKKLEFTEKEIEKMPRKFRTEFRVEGCNFLS